MKTVVIEGMHCHKCVERCEKALNSLEGVSAIVNLDNKTATIEGDVSDNLIKETIEDLGFEVVSIK